MFEKTLERLAAAFKNTGIPYMVIGGQAVLLYGEPRFTRDIDVTLGIGAEDLDRVLSICKKIGLRPLTKNVASFVSETMVLPAVDSKTQIRVDFVFSFTPYEAQAIQRNRKVKMGSQKICFASPEDVIIHKIFAGRPRDHEDVKSILLSQHRLNGRYIEKWLKEFDRTFPGKKFLSIFRRLKSEINQ